MAMRRGRPAKARAIMSERGFTLIETIIGVGIIVLALTMVGLPLALALSRDVDFRDDLTATAALGRAAGWVALDAFHTQVLSINDGSTAIDVLTIDWFDIAGASHTVDYALSGANLVRTLDGNTLIIARRVESAAFSRAGNLLTFTLDVRAATGATDTQTSYHLLRGLP